MIRRAERFEHSTELAEPIMAAELKLYSFKLCPFAHRVRLTLAEKRLDAELVEINLKDKPADFLSISPSGACRCSSMMRSGCGSRQSSWNTWRKHFRNRR
jgi:hypothetical protein